MTTATAPAISLAALNDPAVRADPYPFYHRLRAEDPVHWEDQGRPRWALTRYADVAAALRDPRLSAQRSPWVPDEARESAQGVLQSCAQWLLFRDPPDHTRLRRLLLTAFTPRVVEGMRPLIQQLVDEMLDAVAGAGQMDVIADLAYPLPATVIAALLGVPRADRDRFKAWSNDLATMLDGDPARPERAVRAYQGAAELLAYMSDLVERRRHKPQDDLTQALIATSEHEGHLGAAAVVANCAMLLFAGHETTTNLIGNGLLALLRHPDQLRRLRDDPALIASAVEELLRYDSPVQVTGRLAAEDLEIGGQQIHAGQLVSVFLGAANRDPAQFPDPDRLDLGRAENRHLSFAYGPHFCLGAALARLEGQIALGTLLRRWPALRPATQTVQWRDNFVLRGLVTLPVLLDQS